MSKSGETIRCTKLTKKILLQKKGFTNKSIPELVEYAIVNMPPFIPEKKLKKIR